MPSGHKAASQVFLLELLKQGLAQSKKKRQLMKDYLAMIANNQELIHCVALSYRSLSLLIKRLTSAFASDEGASPLWKLSSAYRHSQL